MKRCSLLVLILILGFSANIRAQALENVLATDPGSQIVTTAREAETQRTDYTAPYSQNFNGAWLPPDWYEISDGSILAWTPYNGWARCNFNWDTPGDIAVLQSPFITIPGYMYRLNFTWSHMLITEYPVDIGRVKIYDLENYSAGWVTVWERKMYEFNSNDGASALNPGSGVQESLDLSSFAGHTIKVEFEGTCGYGPYWFVDNFDIHYTNTSIASFPSTQDFSSTTFPPANWSSPIPGFAFKRSTANGYGAAGTGSAKNFSEYPGTCNIDLNTPFIDLKGSRGILSFDQAYADYADMNGVFDDFVIMYSSNGGFTFYDLVTYSGAPGGDLITAPPGNGAYTPTASQWVTRSLIVPAGTNMVKFRVISRNGGGIIYLDNVRFELGFSGGNGTAADPWLITKAAELDYVRNYLGTANAGKCFKLGSDINLQSYPGWVPLGTSASNFCGTFDGNNLSISNLNLGYYGGNHGLFGFNGSGAVIKNLHLASTCHVLGDAETGSIVGRNTGTVLNCHSAASVNIGNATSGGGLVGFNAGTISGSSFSGGISRSGGGVSCNRIGGISGTNETGAVINNSFSSGSVTGNTWCGGLVGWNNGAISRCYSTGTVGGAENSIGGLVGQHQGSITNSYSRANVSGANYIGGLVGFNGSSTITNSYSTGTVSGGIKGGLCGQSGATVSNSYWDTQSSGMATSFGGTGKTTAQMKTQSTFTGWDFVVETTNGTGDYWAITPTLNNGYPILSWEHADVFLPVALTYPANGATGLPHTGFNLVWTPMPVGQPAYEYEIYMGQGSVSHVYDHYFTTVNITSFNPVTQGGLTFHSGETWFWTINAYTMDGAAVLSEPPSSFQIEIYSSPDTPVVHAVIDNIGTITLVWNPAALANSYKVYASDTPDVAVIPANLVTQVAALSCTLPTTQTRKFYRVVASTEIAFSPALQQKESNLSGTE